jgi:hypothetical protein
MRHALAPTGGDPVGKVVVEGDRVPVVEAAIDPVCGKEVVGQTPPPEGKKLLCLECFSKIEISKEGR